MKLFLVFFVALVCVWIVRALRRRPVLTAAITIAPSGEAHVVFSPDTADPEQLIRLLLCYGSKVRWLLKSETPALTEAFQEFMTEVVGLFSATDVRDLMTDGPLLSEIARNTVSAPSSVPGGEVFSARLFYGAEGKAWVTNDMPRPGLAFNIPWHFPILCQAIRSKLDQDDRRWAQLALQAWLAAAFTENELPQDLNTLRLLTDTANDVTDRARKLA
jgi:hypothetical protein